MNEINATNYSSSADLLKDNHNIEENDRDDHKNTIKLTKNLTLKTYEINDVNNENKNEKTDFIPLLTNPDSPSRNIIAKFEPRKKKIDLNSTYLLHSNCNSVDSSNSNSEKSIYEKSERSELLENKLAFSTENSSFIKTVNDRKKRKSVVGTIIADFEKVNGYPLIPEDYNAYMNTISNGEKNENNNQDSNKNTVSNNENNNENDNGNVSGSSSNDTTTQFSNSPSLPTPTSPQLSPTHPTQSAPTTPTRPPTQSPYLHTMPTLSPPSPLVIITDEYVINNNQKQSSQSPSKSPYTTQQVYDNSEQTGNFGNGTSGKHEKFSPRIVNTIAKSVLNLLRMTPTSTTSSPSNTPKKKSSFSSFSNPSSPYNSTKQSLSQSPISNFPVSRTTDNKLENTINDNNNDKDNNKKDMAKDDHERDEKKDDDKFFTTIIRRVSRARGVPLPDDPVFNSPSKGI